MEEFEAWIKKHYLLAGGVVVGLIFLFILTRSHASSGAAVSSGIDPTTASLYAQEANTAAAQQTQQNNNAAALENARIEAQYGLNLAAVQGANAKDLATISANSNDYATYAGLQLGTTNLATQLAETQSAAGVQIAAIEGQTTDIANELAATQNIANLTAQEQLGIANEQGQVAINQSNNWTQTQIQQANDNMALGYAQTLNAGSVAKTNSNNALWGNVVSTVGGIAKAALF